MPHGLGERLASEGSEGSEGSQGSQGSERCADCGGHQRGKCRRGEYHPVRGRPPYRQRATQIRHLLHNPASFDPVAIR